jgi:hypothetical protein
MKLLQKGFVVWLLLMAMESLHGMARVALLEPALGDLRARQVATFTGSALILILAFFCVGWLGAATKWQLLDVGAFWLLLTVTFELVLGRLVMHLSWERIASYYNLLEGGLMPVGLAVLTFSPLLAGWLHHHHHHGPEQRWAKQG